MTTAPLWALKLIRRHATTVFGFHCPWVCTRVLRCLQTGFVFVKVMFPATAPLQLVYFVLLCFEYIVCFRMWQGLAPHYDDVEACFFRWKRLRIRISNSGFSAIFIWQVFMLQLEAFRDFTMKILHRTKEFLRNGFGVRKLETINTLMTILWSYRYHFVLCASKMVSTISGLSLTKHDGKERHKKRTHTEHTEDFGVKKSTHKSTSGGFEEMAPLCTSWGWGCLAHQAPKPSTKKTQLNQLNRSTIRTQVQEMLHICKRHHTRSSDFFKTECIRSIATAL